MPNNTSNPFIIDHAETINVSEIIKQGYLIYNRRAPYKTENGSLQITSTKIDYDPTLILDYKYGNNTYNYEVCLIALNSNLGKGFVWFFECPITYKRCRKLYLYRGRFSHRSVIQDGMYENQTQSKKIRRIEKYSKSYFNLEQNAKKLYSKNFKTKYNGKLTKLFLRLRTEVDKANSFSFIKFENMF